LWGINAEIAFQYGMWHLMAPWTVFLEAGLVADMRNRGKRAELELVAVTELLREEGPEAFSLYPGMFADVSSWSELREPCPLEFFVRAGWRFLSLQIDIRPNRTIVLKRAARGRV
jgi:hypothetical protein